ncbi:Abscisic acid receptor pyr1 [Thalictrum thalictroides]|uniref:Abscisic acid receptor pyr1 n=1 Tax=Thalictrum thalictroides TaxID=46969 RepID=A0A7J6V3B1_THATH|nr:Abscisic acid receptor pyr1 [Thalictrum thalictroides]
MSSIVPSSSSPSKCNAVLVQHINAPISIVWSIVRQFDKPQVYKRFVQSYSMISGDGGIGTVREIHIISGLPAAISIEQLDILDDNFHVVSFSIIGGDHRLPNYRSIMSLQEKNGEPEKTIVTEFFTVDVPIGSTKEDCLSFICNLVMEP